MEIYRKRFGRFLDFFTFSARYLAFYMPYLFAHLYFIVLVRCEEFKDVCFGDNDIDIQQLRSLCFNGMIC
jgi:hypothetical protein